MKPAASLILVILVFCAVCAPGPARASDRATQVVSGARLVAVSRAPVAAALGRALREVPGGHAQCEPACFPWDVRVPAGRIHLAVQVPPVAARAEAVTARVEITVDGGARRRVSVPWKLNWTQDAWCVRRAVRKGATLAADDLELRAVPLGRLPAGALGAQDGAVGTEATRDLTAGTPVTRGAVRAAPLVHRGERVLVRASVGAVVGEITGEALGDGALGETILVRGVSSRIVLRSRITGPGEVEAERR